MGQTLTHGIYLPDEGERNCYNGLAGNWTILDGAVGTIAEHTSALAGKAPLVHTHGKADITDLFNSANEWSANQKIINNPSYLYLKNTSITKGAAPASNLYSGVVFQDSNNAELSSIVYKKHKNSNTYLIFNVNNTNGTNDYECSINMSMTSAGVATFYPEGADCYLGITGRPWKSLNGINPGALSLPDVSRVTNIDTTGWVFDGSTVNEIKINNAVQTLNGWLYIRLASVSNTDSVGVRYNSSGKSNMTFIAPFVPGASHMTLSCPIVAGVSANVWSTKQPEYIKFYLSLGEVNNFPS